MFQLYDLINLSSKIKPKFVKVEKDRWTERDRSAKLEVFVEGSKTYIPKIFYRTGGSKTYIPKNFYTKTTCTTLLSEKFGGSGAPSGPLNATPLDPGASGAT
ncbi:hypothetical protein Hanom_Chr08g00756271 [Helianthus anomalus]